MLGFVNGDGEGLATAVVGCFDHGDIEFGGVLSQVMGAGHAWVLVSLR